MESRKQAASLPRPPLPRPASGSCSSMSSMSRPICAQTVLTLRCNYVGPTLWAGGLCGCSIFFENIQMAIFRSKKNNTMLKFHEQIFLIKMVCKVKSPGTWPRRKLPEFPDWSSCLSSCDPCRTRGRGNTPALDPMVMSILELRILLKRDMQF